MTFSTSVDTTVFEPEKSPAENSVPVVLSCALVPLMLRNDPATVPPDVNVNADAALVAFWREPAPEPDAADHEGVLRVLE